MTNCGATANAGHGMFATCGEEFYGAVHQCPMCQRKDAIEASRPVPPMQDEQYAPRGRLKPRVYLPGDPRGEWLHGWWAGIGVGAVIGAALMCMVIWSR